MPSKQDSSDILIFVPSYNDSESLIEIVREIEALGSGYRVLVIDDGSVPKLNIASVPPGVLVAQLPANFGLGVCTHVALDHALDHGYQIVVRIDADGQHPVDKIADLVDPVRNGIADVTIGHRTNHDAAGLMGLFGSLTKRYFSIVAKIMTRGRSPGDVNSGFMCFGKKAITTINGFTLERYPEPQIIMLGCRTGLKVHEVEVTQSKRRMGRSSITILRGLQIFYRFNIFVLSEVLQDRHK